MKRLTATLAILFFITACTNAQDKKETTEQSENQAECQHHKKKVNTKTAKKCRLNKKQTVRLGKIGTTKHPKKLN